MNENVDSIVANLMNRDISLSSKLQKNEKKKSRICLPKFFNGWIFVVDRSITINLWRGRKPILIVLLVTIKHLHCFDINILLFLFKPISYQP